MNSLFEDLFSLYNLAIWLFSFRDIIWSYVKVRLGRQQWERPQTFVLKHICLTLVVVCFLTHFCSFSQILCLYCISTVCIYQIFVHQLLGWKRQIFLCPSKGCIEKLSLSSVHQSMEKIRVVIYLQRDLTLTVTVVDYS